jgi:hypothetical protein
MLSSPSTVPSVYVGTEGTVLQASAAKYVKSDD